MPRTGIIGQPNYKWEREIFGQITASRKIHTKELKYATPVMASNTPEFAELPSAVSNSLALPKITLPIKFAPVAVVRIGNVELGLSNAVPESLMRQLKGLVNFAE